MISEELLKVTFSPDLFGKCVCEWWVASGTVYPIHICVGMIPRLFGTLLSRLHWLRGISIPGSCMIGSLIKDMFGTLTVCLYHRVNGYKIRILQCDRLKLFAQFTLSFRTSSWYNREFKQIAQCNQAWHPVLSILNNRQAATVYNDNTMHGTARWTCHTWPRPPTSYHNWPWPLTSHPTSPRPPTSHDQIWPIYWPGGSDTRYCNTWRSVSYINTLLRL